MSEVQIVEVNNKKQLRKFVNLPNKMYKDVPQFVPAFYGDDMSDWDRKKNPAFACYIEVGHKKYHKLKTGF